MKAFVVSALLLVSPFAAVAAHADDGHAMGHGAMHAAMAAPAASAESSGTVTKVDEKAGRITIKHGPLQNLNMPGMTMAFKVAVADMLSAVKAGDAVRFVAEDVGGALTVTRIAKAK